MAYKKDKDMYTGAYKGMLYEDKSKPSNLPTDVIMREYPDTGYVMQSYDDTESGTVKRMEDSVKGLRNNLNKNRPQ